MQKLEMSLLNGCADVVFTTEIMPEFLLDEFNYFETSLPMLQRMCEEAWLLREMKANEVIALENILISLDGNQFFHMTAVLELWCSMIRIKDVVNAELEGAY